MTVVVKIQQLVVPLGHYSERILDEGYDNQKAANGREVPVYTSIRSATLSYAFSTRSDIRLDGFAKRIQDVLNLARLLPDCVERAGLGRVVVDGSSERARGTNAIAAGSPHLRHCVRYDRVGSG